jgi:endonuclease-3
MYECPLPKQFTQEKMINSKTAVSQLKALRRLVKGKEPRLAAEQSKKWQILISTILASQSRDVLTNRISAILYKKYKSPRKLADASLSDIKKIIHPINYYKTKSRHIKETARIISKGIPKTRERLMELPGVGRKVANVYLAEAHNAQAIGVDTHVARISQKLEWTKNKNPYKIEKDLEKLFPKKYWNSINYIVVSFGQLYGNSRRKEDIILSKIRALR